MNHFFQEKANFFQDEYLSLKEKSSNLSWLRTILFILTAASLIYVVSSGNTTFLLLTLALGLAFYFSILSHDKVEEKKTLSQTLATINEEEIKRLKLDLHSFDGGGRFIEETHPYHIDLDIFGKHSVFQLINRCEIEDSKSILANWLSKKKVTSQLIQRQEAAQELAKKVEWTQTFQAKARIETAKKKKHHPDVSAQDIMNWVNKPEALSQPKLWKGFSWFLGCCVVAVGYLILIEETTHLILYPVLLVNGIVLSLGIKHLNALTKGVEKSHYAIASYQKAMEAVEKETFHSTRLNTLKEELLSQNHSASHSIQALAKLIHRRSSRANMFYAMVDILFLLDIHLLIDLYQWKKSHNEEVKHWLDVVNEFECLLSIGSFSLSHPHFAFPTFLENTFHFEAEKLGHPLIPGEEKIRNNYRIAGKGGIDILTGSNMSGKSTFQRTVGINMVLAQAGCPVDAASLKMSPTNVFTSMRTKDNLEEHTSSFYAELKRIAQLLEATENNDSTFFILDEILKGTNSEDRHKGSVALAKKLSQRKAFGIISTHDLGLGQLAETEKKVTNYSFNSTIEDDKIIFDYTLTKGVCRSFNASKLMEKMGIL